MGLLLRVPVFCISQNPTASSKHARSPRAAAQRRLRRSLARISSGSRRRGAHSRARRGGVGMADGGGPSRKRARTEGSSDEDAARRPPNEGEPITSTSEPAEDGSDQQPDAPPELRGATRFAMVRRLGGRVRACLLACVARAGGRRSNSQCGIACIHCTLCGTPVQGGGFNSVAWSSHRQRHSGWRPGVFEAGSAARVPGFWHRADCMTSRSG